jgi:hypothetical protein
MDATMAIERLGIQGVTKTLAIKLKIVGRAHRAANENAEATRTRFVGN